MCKETMKLCECKSLDNYSQDPEIPISFDSKFNEYSIDFGPEKEGKIFLKYCFNCGGLLPESKRGEVLLNQMKNW